MKPIIKWAGGKQGHLKYVRELITQEMLDNGTYIEPFCGGASLAFALQPSKMILCDLNAELINTYLVIKAWPENLIAGLRDMQALHSKDYFYFVRGLDREPEFTASDSLLRACRFIYLNKTCFNGLYRVNSKGYFNTPIGRSSSGKEIDIVQEDKIRNLYHYFNRNSIDFICGDYLAATAKAKSGDVVVLDPPYTQTNHTSYQKEGFTWEDTKKLKTECDRLNQLGCHIIVFNESTPEIKELFKDYEIREVSVKRTVSCKSSGRQANEVIITNIKS